MSERNRKSGHPEFYNLLRELADLHSKKSEDYDAGKPPLSVFDGLSSFIDKPENVHLILAKIKMNRLEGLLKTGVKPNFESVEDTVKDICVYLLMYLIKKRGF